MASRTTSKAKQHYPQIDLEAMSLDFALRRFRHYIIGARKQITVITDHKPLCNIFNLRRKGSVRTERIKLRHQDIPFTVVYQQGAKNQSDYLSRHAMSLHLLTESEQKEANELNNLLYCLHTVPITDCIGLSDIAKESACDKILSTLQDYIKQGKQHIPKTELKEVQRFNQMLSEITVT